MNPVPAFPSVADAMTVVQAGLRFVAAADATQMSAQAQAECLQMMERANAIVTAAGLDRQMRSPRPCSAHAWRVQRGSRAGSPWREGRGSPVRFVLIGPRAAAGSCGQRGDGVPMEVAQELSMLSSNVEDDRVGGRR